MKVMMRMMTTAMTGGCWSAAASSPSSLIYCRILRRRGAAFPFHRSTSSIATLLLPCERYSVHTRASLLDGRHLHKSYAFVGTSGKVSAMSGASKARGPEFQSPRQVVKKVLSKPQYDGDGAVVRRSIGRPELRNLDPFLMLDEFSVTAPAGFPDHPHRGFETVTYMLQGSFTHQDFAGHKGTIGPGDLQWMTAGRGIIHSEMPAGEGANTGLQLWINLSSKDKMIEPRYQELQSKDISRVEEDGVEVRIIAGEAFGVKSPVYTRTPTMYLDFTMKPGAEVRQPVPEGWNAFIYVLEGEGVFGAPESSPVAAHHTLVLGAGNGLIAWNRSEESLRFVLIGGQPLNEPVVQHGPFVMNTKAEIEKTIEDYHFSRNGFEKARHWKSQPLMP